MSSLLAAAGSRRCHRPVSSLCTGQSPHHGGADCSACHVQFRRLSRPESSGVDGSLGPRPVCRRWLPDHHTCRLPAAAECLRGLWSTKSGSLSGMRLLDRHQGPRSRLELSVEPVASRIGGRQSHRTL